MDLAQLRAGQSATVVEIRGGMRLMEKLASLGIMTGTKIKKISSQFMNGPITIQSGNTQVALGYGMAKRIIVEPEE
ncbi:MAG: ferrous iron transport protein A [Elusimicrobia bacterium]|nr:ferrous iron transport protein A [Elusimicrobiota bacterium]